MSLITLFSAPKPFSDRRIAIIQDNAISSWGLLPEVTVVLMGQEPGLAEAAERHGVAHVAEIGCNSSGTPLVSSMIRVARERYLSPLLCIINGDMIVMRDLVTAAESVMRTKSRFVLLSRRWDLDVRQPIAFSDGWEQRLEMEVQERGVLHRPAGSDFFLFPRSCYVDVPAFAVGRSGWDNWMIFRARKERWPVVDGTPSMTLIHQTHDYGHLPGGAPHYNLPESAENVRLAGGEASIRYTIVDATHCLEGGRLRRPHFGYLHFMRWAELALRSALFFLPSPTVEQWARPKRWKKRFLKFLRKD